MSKSQASKEYIQRIMDIKEKNNIENQVNRINWMFVFVDCLIFAN